MYFRKELKTSIRVNEGSVKLTAERADERQKIFFRVNVRECRLELRSFEP